MSSILTNTSAMVALQTMRGINQNLAQTQNEISTGKSVANARDNAAVWAVSRTMAADVNGFTAISDTLALGRSTVGVARTAAETVTDLLTDMQGKIVAAQEDNVDRAKIQSDVVALRDQINSVVGAAQFNGLNLVNGTSESTVNVLSSLDRASDGTVTTSNIEVGARNFTTDAAVFGDGDSLDVDVTGLTGADEIAATNNADVTFAGTAVAADAGTRVFTIDGVEVTVEVEVNDSAADVAGSIVAAITGNETLQERGITASSDAGTLTITAPSGFDDIDFDLSAIEVNEAAPTGGVGQVEADSIVSIEFDSTVDINQGDGYRVTAGGEEFVYVASAGDTYEDIANALRDQINGSTDFEARVNETTGALEVINTSGADVAFAADGAEEGIAAGGLFDMEMLDVSTRDGAQSALDAIEGLIQFAIGAAADFGSAQGRIDTQAEFVQNLTDALTTGIGSLVDADMEAASARLQALQVQQQLATQSLSIANQAPQNILALFR